MRTIKFRARRIDGKNEFNLKEQKFTDLVYGSLFIGRTGAGLYYLIEDEDCNEYEVDKNTICQYTNLKDKNGEELYEGDTISLPGNTYKIMYDTQICAFVLDKPFRNTDKDTPIGVILNDLAFKIIKRYGNKEE